MDPIWRATRVGRKLNILLKDRFLNYLDSLPENVELIVRAFRSQRSNEQNRYYWGVVLKILSEHTGYSCDEIHEILKSQNDITRDILELNGKVYPIIKSTSSLNTKEMEEYLSQCRQWASVELGCYVPLPREIDY